MSTRVLSRRVPLIGVLLLSLGFADGAGASSHSDAVGLDPQGRLVGFDYENPAVWEWDIPITGTPPNEPMLAIDFSPNGQLFGVGGSLSSSTRHLYSINVSTGQATEVGSGFTLAGNIAGVDVDALRAFIASIDNATRSVDLATGAAANGPDLAFSGGAPSDVAELARIGNTLFGLERNSGALVRVNEATGALEFVGGPLGVSPWGFGGFDVGNNGSAVAVLDDRIYTINLTTGQASAPTTLPRILNGFTVKPSPGTPGGGTPSPDLAVDLDGPDGLDGPLSAFPGELITYTLTVTNVGEGPSPASGVNIDDAGSTSIDRDTRFLEHEPSGTCQGLGSLEPCLVSVPALKEKTGSAQYQIVVDGGADFLLFPPLGDRTLVATLSAAHVDPDTAAGPNEDRHVTSLANAPKNDSNVGKVTPKAVTGTASGNVESVEVAVLQASGGARAAAARCQWVSRNGKLRQRPATRRRCLSATWLKAKGTRRWRLRLRRKLRPGKYVVYSRAITAAGAPENRFSARDRNRRAVRIR